MIFEKLTATDGTKIPVHAFCSAVSQWARGKRTRQQVIDAFGLSGTDLTEIDALATTYTGKSGAAAKADYLSEVEDVFILCEAGFYTKNQAKADLGF